VERQPSRAEILGLLGDTSVAVPTGFLTAKEWQEQLGLSEKKTYEAMRQLQEKGCLEVSRRKVVSLSGASRGVPVYKVNLPKAGGK